MALTRKGENYAYGTNGVTASGIAVVTGFEASREFETNVTAKDADGIVKAHLFGNEVDNASVEGYLAGTDPGDANVPGIGTGTITVGDIEVPIMRASIQGSNEDFARVRLEGTGYKDVSYA